jgi:hypothetical protein
MRKTRATGPDMRALQATAGALVPRRHGQALAVFSGGDLLLLICP